MKLMISVSAYDEISAALEKHGIKADGTTSLTLEKGTQLASPVDFRMVTIRRDVANVAAQVYKSSVSASSFIDFTDELLNYVLYGKQEIKISKIEKAKGSW